MFHRNKIGFTAKSFVLIALVAALASSFSGTAAASPARQAEGDLEHLRGLTGQQFEIEWLSMMIEHHQGAIEMAQLADTRAKHQEIKTVAQNIIQDQTREIGEMKTWLMQWYNTEPMTGMMHEGMMAGMDMSMLESMSGDDFDRAFLMMMHAHHRGAIAMAELVPDRATHQEVKTLGQNITTSQEAEIMQFMAWAQTWYKLDLMTATGMGAMEGTAGAAGTPPAGMPRTGISGTASWLGTLLASVAALTVAGGLWVRRRSAL
ncbi:MAG: DUF305 domain-containing protein [Chloroflexota bacterium]